MPPPDASESHVVAAALLGAFTEARWRRSDLLSRKPADLAPDLLRGHAAEMAFSPIGRDQVLSLALFAAANDLDAGRAPSDERAAFLCAPAPDESARLTVRARTLSLSLAGASEARGVVEELERRHRPECDGGFALSERLRNDASLHELLWDDPRLPCADLVRLTMLFSVPRLLERADVLAGRNRTDKADGVRPKPVAGTDGLRRPWARAIWAALGRR
jgi:hypothetical protein